ncbi:hypothetical protein ACVRZR_06450 [Streptococcus entericus]|uniref:hypothetical protein n=1 Tax=Streptococcus entericus TaxID=155680 RepID=UPI0004772C40|nr:hypothetical protein [Streptococcus entericus]
MIATIRTHANGNSHYLCDLDLMKFSEEQVRERMRERGISDDAFFICGFKDWGIDSILSLREAYMLKLQIEHLYDGDDYLIRFMLRSRKSLYDIETHYYKFFSKDELAVMQHLLKHAETAPLLEAFFRAGSWVNFMLAYVEAGYILNTPRGFYLDGNVFKI